MIYLKILIYLMNALMSAICDNMKEIEKTGEKDDVGLPVSPQYEELGFVLASFRDINRELGKIKNQIEDDKNEK